MNKGTALVNAGVLAIIIAGGYSAMKNNALESTKHRSIGEKHHYYDQAGNPVSQYYPIPNPNTAQKPWYINAYDTGVDFVMQGGYMCTYNKNDEILGGRIPALRGGEVVLTHKTHQDLLNKDSRDKWDDFYVQLGEQLKRDCFAKEGRK